MGNKFNQYVIILLLAALTMLSTTSYALPPPPPDVASSGGGGGGGIQVPVMEGWWLLPGLLAGIGLFARRRKE